MGLLIDGAIIILYFSLILYIGLTLGRRDESLKDFALGGRRIPWWAVMASIIAAETSAATFLGTPGEGFDKRSIIYVQLVFGLIIGRYIVGYVFLKPYYTYKVYTVYDYLAVRFGPASKGYVSGLFLLMRTLASGTRLFIPSLVMVLAWRMFTGGEVEYSQTAVNSVTPYVVAIVFLTIATCVYTAIGGIKAVIWTDVIQACLMFGSALVAIGTLLYHIGGIGAIAEHVPEMTRLEGYIRTGFETEVVGKWMTDHQLTAMGFWDYAKLILASDYTLFSALIGATLSNMAAFGTDQDMVQRMLTAETHQKARRSLITAAFMDLPIAAAFSFIGVLLFVFYTQQNPAWKPQANADVFGAYIMHAMPVGIRGLVLAGVFATAMGSFSAALNALATSATNDWYLKYVRGREERHYVKAARIFTVIFALLMVIIAGAFAWAKVHDPNIRIIPVVLGIAGFILGPMLGVFLIGMLTRGRGSDGGNMLAITAGLIVSIAVAMNGKFWAITWLPAISFVWWGMLGALVVFGIGVLFRTPPEVLQEADRIAAEAHAGEDRPMALRPEAADSAA